VLDKKMSVAIRSGRNAGHAPELSWDVEVSLGGCGVPLPDWIEDWALSRLGLLVVRSFNRVNLIELDFAAMAEEEAADANDAERREQATRKLPPADTFLSAFPKLRSDTCLGEPNYEAQTFVGVAHHLFALSAGDFDKAGFERALCVKAKDGSTVCLFDGTALPFRRRLLVNDFAGAPLACVVEKGGGAYLVHAVKPYLPNQPPTGETVADRPLYAWAKIWKRSVASSRLSAQSATPEYFICMATGRNTYEADSTSTTRASYSGKAPAPLSEKLTLSRFGRGCLLIDRKELQWGSLRGTNSYELTIAPGTDPVLMVILCAVRDQLRGDDEARASAAARSTARGSMM